MWAKTDHLSPHQKFSFMEDKTAARATNLGALPNYRDVKQDVAGRLVTIMTANFPNGFALLWFWERLPDRHQ